MDTNTDDKSVKEGRRFISILGYVFILMFVGSLYTIYVSLTFLHVDDIHFWVVTGIWYLITGICLLTRRILGYYFLKLFLYIFLIGFPIGTIISYKLLKYIKKHNVKYHFK
jgi:hypothetical protein